MSPNQGVFVEEVEVTAPQGPPVIFPCRCWLAEDEDDGQTTRVLVPGQSLTSRYDSKDEYRKTLSCYLIFQHLKGVIGSCILKN